MSAPLRASCNVGLSCNRKPLRNQWTEFTTMFASYSIVREYSTEISRNGEQKNTDLKAKSVTVETPDELQGCHTKTNTEGAWPECPVSAAMLLSLYLFTDWAGCKTSTRVTKLKNFDWLIGIFPSFAETNYSAIFKISFSFVFSTTKVQNHTHVMGDLII